MYKITGMERGARPDKSEDPDYESGCSLKRVIINELKMMGVPPDERLASLLDDTIGSEAVARAQQKLVAMGIEADSLTMLEAVIELTTEPWPGGQEEDPGGQGGLGVREPRRPLPGSGSGSIALASEVEHSDGESRYYRPETST